MEVPLFWGAAHRVTAEILEEEQNRLDPELDAAKIAKLNYEIKRAYEISQF